MTETHCDGGLPGAVMADSDDRELLAARRALLVQRAAAQRQQLAQAAAPLAQSWRWFERGVGLWREVQRRPWLVAVPAGVLLFWRPRAVLGPWPRCPRCGVSLVRHTTRSDSGRADASTPATRRAGRDRRAAISVAALPLITRRSLPLARSCSGAARLKLTRVPTTPCCARKASIARRQRPNAACGSVTADSRRNSRPPSGAVRRSGTA